MPILQATARRVYVEQEARAASAINCKGRHNMTLQMSLHLPDYARAHEHWTFFGLAVYFAQVYEKTVSSAICLILRADNLITEEEGQNLLVKLDRMTLGQVIAELKRTPGVDNDLAEETATLLRQRNFLIHDFWHTRIEMTFNLNQRRKVIDELRDIAGRLWTASETFAARLEPQLAALGKSKEQVDALLAASIKTELGDNTETPSCEETNLNSSPSPSPLVNFMPATPGRNATCWCGSGTRYKRCHGKV